MGLFSTSSSFDTDVEKATDEKNTSEEWSLIMEICDKVGSSSQHAKDCLRSIVKRLNHQDPHIVMQAITLLDACANNCGRNFQLEISSRDFETELRKLLQRSQPKVVEKLKQLLRKWAEGDFKSDPQLSLIPSLYSKLKQEGMDFSTDIPTKLRTGQSKDPNAVSSQQEVDDIAKAIELSLKESQPSPKSHGGGGGYIGSTNLYPSTSLNVSSEPRKVRALYDFEAVEDNELTFNAGEIIHVLDDSDPNWWKGYNQRGEGLFPANFVSSDLSVEPERKNESKKGVQFNETVEVKTIKVVEQVEIEEEKIDRLLHMLHEADPNEDQLDTEDMLALEEQVNAMGPLIDTELERVDRKHAQLTQLSSGLVEALNLYHTLMREPFHSPKPVPFSPPPQQPIYNGLGPGAYSMPPEYILHQHHQPPGAAYSITGPPLPMPLQDDLAGPQSLPPQSHPQHIPFPQSGMANYGPPLQFLAPGPQQGMPPSGSSGNVFASNNMHQL
uniref:Signal transducing adapter molecule 1 n=2 Tax=Clastoptera arizonana TaxID=38151 RepID=A0A1B6DGK9_9HEMI